MSVDTRAGFFYGWIVSPEERDAMIEAYEANTGNNEIIDCFEPINCFRPNSGYLFGTWLSYFPDPGYFRTFHADDMIDIPGKEFYDEYASMLIAAERKDMVDGWYPEVFCVHTVW